MHRNDCFHMIEFTKWNMTFLPQTHSKPWQIQYWWRMHSTLAIHTGSNHLFYMPSFHHHHHHSLHSVFFCCLQFDLQPSIILIKQVSVTYWIISKPVTLFVKSTNYKFKLIHTQQAHSQRGEHYTLNKWRWYVDKCRMRNLYAQCTMCTLQKKKNVYIWLGFIYNLDND